jgi:ADP-heptose:LPS heptosyltransferase
MSDLHILDGGVGKHIMFTSLLQKLYEKNNKKLIVNSAYPEIFNYSPYVADSRIIVNEVFFDTYYNYFRHYDNIFYNDPYKSDFLKGEKHVLQKWSEMYEIKLNSYRPNFSINTDRESELLPHIKKINKFVLLQFTGGQGMLSNQYDKNNFGRNYKYGQDLIYLLQEQYPTHLFIVFGHDNERPAYVGETKFNDQGGSPLFKNREDFMILSKHCDFFITIDSALHHMCANQSFNKKGIVLWGTTKPEIFGYSDLTNMVSEYPYCVEIEPKKIVDEVSNI